MLRSRVTWLEYLQSLKPAEHVEGEACQVEHEAGHQDCVQGGEDPAHQVQAGGGGQTLVMKVKTNTKRETDLPALHCTQLTPLCPKAYSVLP